MTLLILGLALWIAAHVFKRVAPGPRAALQDRMGDASKGIFAVLILASLVLMVLGHRWADPVFVWAPPTWGVHVNNLLMLVAVALFGVGNSKSRLRRHFRHPMLWGFSLWAVAHLLVNGDLASIVLFGVLLLWALLEMGLINRAEPGYVPYDGGSLAGDVRLAAIAVVLYAIIAGIHAWLGVWPFPG